MPIKVTEEVFNINLPHFYSKIDKTPGFGPEGDCWRWIGRPTGGGYGRYKDWLAHRVMKCLIENRIIAPKEMVCHKCDNPICVNPDHLFIGDATSNAVDAVDKNRFLLGEKNYNSKITWEKAQKIRELYKDHKYTRKEIINKLELSISEGQVTNILKNRSWRSREYQANLNKYNNIPSKLLDKIKFCYDIDPVSECWVWNKKEGSGPLKARLGKYDARKLSYYLKYGECPKQVYMICSSKPACLNPEHMSKKSNKGVPQILTKIEVKQIKNKLLEGETTRLLSLQFKVSENTIRDIKFGRTWRNA